MATPHALDFRAFESLEEMPNHVQTYPRACLPNFSNGKKAGLGVNGRLDQRRLRATWSLDLPGALLELRVTTPDHSEQQVHPGREFMAAFMPVL